MTATGMLEALLDSIATITGLTSGTKYHILLRVVNKSDVSKASDTIKAYTTDMILGYMQSMQHMYYIPYIHV